MRYHKANPAYGAADAHCSGGEEACTEYCDPMVQLYAHPQGFGFLFSEGEYINPPAQGKEQPAAG